VIVEGLKWIAIILFMFHVEQAKTSLIVIQRCVRNDQRFFAKPVLSEAEGLRMTMLPTAFI
jgi:hypothetical protein